MSAINQLATLRSELPNLFEDKFVGQDWMQDFIILPIDDPESYEFDLIDDAELDPNQFSELLIPEADRDFEDNNEPYFQSHQEIAIHDPKIIEYFGGQKHGGSLREPDTKDVSIPPDCLAFYQPFHYFMPDWWGIYLRADGVEHLAMRIQNLSPDSISLSKCRAIARMYLYYHEAFHHKTECFATRLETSHRIPLYKNGFEKLYAKTVMSSKCLEESLAEASALDNVRIRLLKAKEKRIEEIMLALEFIVRFSPPGYAEGADMIKPFFSENRAEFSELNMKQCFPKGTSASPGIWEVSNHMFNGIANVKSRVCYIVPRNSPIAARISGIRGRMSSREIIKKLQKLVGLKKITARHGRHPSYHTEDKRLVLIPDHSRDIKNGTLKSIINQAGLNLSPRQFQNS
ncbi:type II toxin-antitoxin system HicA family toxin [Verrucomicrobia bacterium]|nr:type II toxin-antitoxin system HicA family toxin [Verrucomicrobiota bacterium]